MLSRAGADGGAGADSGAGADGGEVQTARSGLLEGSGAGPSVRLQVSHSVVHARLDLTGNAEIPTPSPTARITKWSRVCDHHKVGRSPGMKTPQCSQTEIRDQRGRSSIRLKKDSQIHSPRCHRAKRRSSPHARTPFIFQVGEEVSRLSPSFGKGPPPGFAETGTWVRGTAGSDDSICKSVKRFRREAKGSWQRVWQQAIPRADSSR